MNIELATIDYLKEQNIHFCMPCKDGTISEETFHSFNKWATVASMMNIRWSVYTYDENKSRNAATMKFLAGSEGTHLMYISPGVKFDPHELLALLSAKKHIIGAMSDASLHKSGMSVEGTVKEVDKVSLNFALLSREAFTHLADLGMYFDSEIDDAAYMCGNWKSLGGKVWSQTGVIINTVCR